MTTSQRYPIPRCSHENLLWVVSDWSLPSWIQEQGLCTPTLYSTLFTVLVHNNGGILAVRNPCSMMTVFDRSLGNIFGTISSIVLRTLSLASWFTNTKYKNVENIPCYCWSKFVYGSWVRPNLLSLHHNIFTESLMPGGCPNWKM